MKTMKKDEIYSEAVDLWGPDIQIDICIEECAELIKALCKFKRYGMDINYNSDEVIEEIVDVQIMINQMKFAFGEARYYELKGDKIMELLQRMDKTRAERKEKQRRLSLI